MTAMVWDVAAGSLLQSLKGHSGTVWTVAWSTSGYRVI